MKKQILLMSASAAALALLTPMGCDPAKTELHILPDSLFDSLTEKQKKLEELEEHLEDDSIPLPTMEQEQQALAQSRLEEIFEHIKLTDVSLNILSVFVTSPFDDFSSQALAHHTGLSEAQVESWLRTTGKRLPCILNRLYPAEYYMFHPGYSLVAKPAKQQKTRRGVSVRVNVNVTK